MTDVRELYQEVLIDHYRHPRNLGTLASPAASAEGDNPLCGDRVKVFVDVADGRVRDVTFEGNGCAISTASASLMTEIVKGKTVDEALQIFAAFHAEVTGDGAVAALAEEDRERLACLFGVRAYPMRVKCATLAWHTLRSALELGATPTRSDPEQGVMP